MKRAGVGKEGGGRGKLRWGKNERGGGEGGRGGRSTVHLPITDLSKGLVLIRDT